LKDTIGEEIFMIDRFRHSVASVKINKFYQQRLSCYAAISTSNAVAKSLKQSIFKVTKAAKQLFPTATSLPNL
jgi:hypothetical protein